MIAYDYYAHALDSGRIFQWNFSGVKATRQYCWDLDGVICTDPNVYDDDGEMYRDEILNYVKPLHLPQVKVKAIITNRIERWRTETECWLRKYGVQYEHLIMQPYASAVERREKSNPAKFKSDNFIKLDGTLFIESDDKQAKQISKLSGRPVVSIESMRIFTNQSSI